MTHNNEVPAHPSLRHRVILAGLQAFALGATVLVVVGVVAWGLHWLTAAKLGTWILSGVALAISVGLGNAWRIHQQSKDAAATSKSAKMLS